jgi:hypothetical protein
MLGVYLGVQECVVPVGVDVGVGAHNRGESFTVARERGWLEESDTTYGARGMWGRRCVCLDVSDQFRYGWVKVC